jgi:hypothetical protein
MRSAAPVPHINSSVRCGQQAVPAKMPRTANQAATLRGCAKTEVALRDELSLSLRPRPAEFAAADRPHAKGPGPAVPTALDPVRGMCGHFAHRVIRIYNGASPQPDEACAYGRGVCRQAEVVAHQLSHTPQVDSIFNVPAGKDNLCKFDVSTRCRYRGLWHSLTRTRLS